MSTNPVSNFSQPQYVTLSPEWFALHKIGGAYRLLFQINLISFILMVVFVLIMAGFYFNAYQEVFQEFSSMVVTEAETENLTAEENSAISSGAKPGLNQQQLEENFKKSFGETGLAVIGLFILAFFLIGLVQFVIQIIVLIRFANCPASIVPGGHGVGLVYAICEGIALFLNGATGALGQNSPLVQLLGPLNIAVLVLFLVFSWKISSTVRSEDGKTWLKYFIGAFCGLFVIGILASFGLIFLAMTDSPEIINLACVGIVLIFLFDLFFLWFSLLKLYRSLGRDVPCFIEKVQKEYISSLT